MISQRAQKYGRSILVTTAIAAGSLLAMTDHGAAQLAVEKQKLSNITLSALRTLQNPLYWAGFGAGSRDQETAHADPLDASVQDQWKMAISAIARLSLPQREIVRKTSPKPRTRLFGATPVRFGAIPSARRLSAAMQEGAVEPATAMRCATAICEAVIDRIHGDADDAPGFMALVQRINTSVNAQIRYAADTETVGQLDHWSMPAETIERGAGDCEDFAILKMAALEEAGVPAKSMSVVVLKDTRRHLYHAVLAIRTNAGFLILDNARDDVLLDSQIPEYRPLYSVGAAGNHIYGYRQNTQTALSLGNFNEIAPGAGY